MPKFHKFDWENKALFVGKCEGKLSQAAILIAMGLKAGSNNYLTLRKWAKVHNYVLPIKPKDGVIPVGRKFVRTLTDEVMFSVNSAMNVSGVKYRIKKDKLIEYKCQICQNDGTWNGARLALHLDHKNGKRADNRLTNLRYLCPNCHSQTDTYSNKKRKTKRLSNPKGSIRIEHRKFNPTKEELELLVWSKSTTQVAKDFGVSDNAIGRRCRLLGIEKPAKGYWMKKKYGKL